MSLIFQPYNLTLPSYSPVFNYAPYRDGSSSLGWNSSYTNYSVNDALNNEAAVPVGYFRGIGAAYRTTSFPGASVSLDFTGTAIYLCFATQAQWTYRLDGTQSYTTGSHTDAACAIYGSHATTLVVSTDLQPGTHTAVLVMESSDASLDFYGATVTMNAGAPGPKTTRVISQADSGWDWQGGWITATDDPYYWNGIIRYAPKWGSSNIATYTFQNASAVILRGLSMFNYGPYTVTLDNVSATFNASDLYWRHSPAIIYFASGLNPNQAHTIQIMNFDANFPNEPPPTIGPDGFLNTAVGTLELIMDDIESRNSVLATFASTLTSPSKVSTTTIAAVVLGGAVFLLVGSNAFFLLAWCRVGRALRSNQLAVRAPNPWADTDGLLPASTDSLGDTIPTSEPVTQIGWASMPTQARVEYSRDQARKQVLQSATNASNDTPLRPATQTGYPGNVGDTPQYPMLPIASPSSQPTQPDQPQVFDHLATSLSTLLNGHLHAEYLRRERELDGMSETDGPPTYRDE